MDKVLKKELGLQLRKLIKGLRKVKCLFVCSVSILTT